MFCLLHSSYMPTIYTHSSEKKVFPLFTTILHLPSSPIPSFKIKLPFDLCASFYTLVASCFLININQSHNFFPLSSWVVANIPNQIPYANNM